MTEARCVWCLSTAHRAHECPQDPWRHIAAKVAQELAQFGANVPVIVVAIPPRAAARAGEAPEQSEEPAFSRRLHERWGRISIGGTSAHVASDPWNRRVE